MKACEQCGENLPEDCASNRRFCPTCATERNRQSCLRSEKKRYANNREKLCARQRAYRHEDPQKHRDADRKKRLGPNREKILARERQDHFQRKYGLTLAERDALVKSQNGKCALCQVAEAKSGGRFNKLHVDHCHETGCVRAMLCQRCNQDLGKVEKLRANGLLSRMLKYADQYKQVLHVA